MLNSKIMIFLIIVSIFLLPLTLNMPDQTQGYSLVVGVGIDKSADEYEISTQVITSKASQGFLETLQVHSAKGNNVLDAVEKLSLHLGRISGFGNTSAIVFSEEVAKEGIANVLDFFLRSKRLNGNPIIIITKSSAKDILSDASKIDESFNYNLNSLAKLNQDFANGTIATLETFLNNYYGKTTATVISQINETNNEDDGILIPESNSSSTDGGANGGSSGSGSSGQSGKEKKVLSNSGESSLFVGDKQIATISADTVESMNILTGAKRNAYTIKNVSDDIYRNATVVLSVKDSFKTRSLDFSKNGIPRVHYNCYYAMKVEEILQDGVDPILLDGTNNYLTPTLIEKIREQIAQKTGEAVNEFKSYNADVYGLQSAFYRYHPKKWQKFLENLDDKNEAFQKIEFFVNVHIDGNL